MTYTVSGPVGTFNLTCTIPGGLRKTLAVTLTDGASASSPAACSRLTITTDNGSMEKPLRFHSRFEWDAGKAKTNLNKHAVSFEDAATVLADEQADRFHVEEYDDAHSMEEDRWITTASHPSDRRIVLRLVWTPRTRSSATVTRIIGARPATRWERKIYEDEIASQ